MIYFISFSLSLGFTTQKVSHIYIYITTCLYVQNGYFNSKKSSSFFSALIYALFMSEVAAFDNKLSSLFPSMEQAQLRGLHGKKQKALAEETFTFTVYMFIK